MLQPLPNLMKRCIALAQKAKEQSCSPVGALIVNNGKIIAEGYEGENTLPTPAAHAEMVAVLKAIETMGSKNLSNCVLYTTKEPCFMCSYLIRVCKIKEIVFASPAQDIGGATSAFPILTTGKVTHWEQPPIVIGDFLREEVEKILA